MANGSATTAYLCPDGHLRTGSPGTCPEHGTQLQAATHRCPECGVATLMAGSCPQCGSALKAI